MNVAPSRILRLLKDIARTASSVVQGLPYSQSIEDLIRFIYEWTKLIYQLEYPLSTFTIHRSSMVERCMIVLGMGRSSVISAYQCGHPAPITSGYDTVRSQFLGDLRIFQTYRSYGDDVIDKLSEIL